MVVLATEVMVSVFLLFAGIAILVLIHLCVVGRAFREGGGIASGSGPSISVTKRMSSEDIKMLPSFQFGAGDDKGIGVGIGVLQMDCAVCLESFMEGEVCRLLPSCVHSFHACCIDSWILKTPVCRASISSASPASNRKMELGSGASSGETSIPISFFLRQPHRLDNSSSFGFDN